jgi:hypothetical protein
VRSLLQAIPNLFVTAVDAIPRQPGWAVRAEVVAPRVPAPEEIRQIEQDSAKRVGEPIELSVRVRTDMVVTGTRYRAVGAAAAEEGSDP